MPIIGLDLGYHRFRAVELQKEKDFYMLTNYGGYDGPDLALEFNSKENLAKYSTELRKFMKDNRFGTSRVIVALPEQEVFIRVIKTPVLSHAELVNFVSLAAEEFIPLPIADVTFDVQIIGTVTNNTKTDGIKGKSNFKGKRKDAVTKSMKSLLVASRNETLSKYVTFLKSAGLSPRGLEPDTLAVERVLGDTQGRSGATVIVNTGFRTTQIIITYKGFVRFTRSLPIGGDSLTKAIQKELNLEYIQANEYKKAYGLDEGQVEGKVFSAIKPVFDQILLDINKSKTYYTTHNPSVIINRVILSGGTAQMPGLLLYIANKLDVEVELANPWRSIKLAKHLKDRRDELIALGPVYSSAVGLALKKI